jgi:predicted DNA-binding transcriptional regulator YafY
MNRASAPRRRPAVNISLGRASRLYRLVSLLAEAPRDRDALLTLLGVGLRTFYRELDLLRRCAIKVHRVEKAYALKTSPDESQGRLPFPDPQLSFAEMIELSKYGGLAASRLARLLESVVNPTPTNKRTRGKAKTKG